MADIGLLLMYVASFFGLFTALYFLLTLFENKSQLKSPEPKYFPTVTIIVPAYNEEETIADTLDSILALDYPKNKLTIMVIDDGSTDKTYAIAKKYAAQGIVSYSKKNEGKGIALNFALSKTDSDLVGALDADSYVDSNALKRIVGFFENENVMAVTPSMKIWSPKSVWQKVQMIEYLVGIFLRKVFAFFGSIHVTPGPFTIYRKSFFDKYGGYDHSTITEDIEIALRIQKNNYIIENSVDAFVYTKGPKDFGPLFRQRIRWYRGFLDNVIKYRSLFGRKHGNLGLFILPSSFFSVFLVIMILIYTLFKWSVDAYEKFFNWYYIGFDLSYLLDFKLDPFFINLQGIVFLAVISLASSFFVIYIAKRLGQDSTKIKISYVLYFFIYWLLFGTWWIVAIYYKISGKKIAWAGRMM